MEEKLGFYAWLARKSVVGSLPNKLWQFQPLKNRVSEYIPPPCHGNRVVSKRKNKFEKMAKNQKRWVYRPKKPPSPKVPERVKAHVENQANQLIESFLKPTYIKPAPEEPRFNYLVDLSTKWYRNYFYFCSRYCSPGPDAISPYFEDKFARLEYAGNDSFHLAFMRHTGQWQELYQDLTLEECLQSIQEEPFFQP